MMDAGVNLSSFGAGARGMGQGGSGVLTSWKAVATYMGKGVRTVQRWEQDFGLPVRRPMGSDKKAVIAFAHDLDTWVALRCTRSRPARAAGDSDPASMQQRMETAMALRTANRLVLNEMKVALASLRCQLAAMSSTAGSATTQSSPASGRPMGAGPELFAGADRKQKIDGGKLAPMPVTPGMAVEQPNPDAAGPECLQSLIEMQEAMNEELQSMHEELQMSREELESANEALHRVNEEMQRRNGPGTQRNDGVVLAVVNSAALEEMAGAPTPARERAGKKSPRGKQ